MLKKEFEIKVISVDVFLALARGGVKSNSDPGIGILVELYSHHLPDSFLKTVTRPAKIIGIDPPFIAPPQS